MKTIHKILYQDSRNLENIPSESIDLIVTSPPYPMIEMWDEVFGNQNPDILKALSRGDGPLAFNLMHEILNSVWNEAFRVLKNGRFACINIGDATRKVKDDFCLYTIQFSNEFLLNRLQKHLVFLKRRTKESKPMKYNNKHYGFPIVTSQEQSILLNNLEEIHSLGNNAFEVLYSNVPQSIKPSSYDSKQFLSETIEATPSPFFSNSVV